MTEPFQINSQQWRISATILRPGSIAGALVCAAIKEPSTGRQRAGDCFRSNGTGPTYPEGGTYYLEIASQDQWGIVVEELR